MANSEVTENMNFDQISNLFKTAEDKGRHQLYEHETYALLKFLGTSTPPSATFLKKAGDIRKKSWDLSWVTR